MGHTFAEKILAKKAGLQASSPGRIVEVCPDVALSHDNSAAIERIFREMGAESVRDPERLALFLDHASPAPTTDHAENHRLVRSFVNQQGIPHFFDIGRGICHQVLVEEGLALPGELVLGADSHTPHAGVMGAFAAGIGRTELASVWALGKLWLRVPESLKIVVEGEMPAWVRSKDLALDVIGRLGASGALYMSVEWHGSTISAMSLEARAVLANMAVEMGAKNSFIPPDDKVLTFLADRAQRPFEPIYPDPEARYKQRLEVEATALNPMIACPHAVDHVQSLEKVAGTEIQQAFIGTCTNGRYEDLADAASILRGRRVAQGARLIVIPASSQIYALALENGILETLHKAGAIIQSPGCGPCMGNHLGVPAPGEVTVSTANRNFRGRMGTRESRIYLASPAVVAASAVVGAIAHPQQVID